MRNYLLFSICLEAVFLYAMRYSQNTFWRRFAWGVAGGFSTGFQNFVKDAITIFQLTPIVDWVRPWRLPWILYVLLLSAGVTAGGGLAILAACMKRYDVTYASGTFAGSLTLCATIMSALHYHTFDHLTNAVLYVMGVGILIAGVGLLMYHSHHHGEDHNESSSNDKDASSKCPTASSNSTSTTTISDEEASHLLLPEGNKATKSINHNNEGHGDIELHSRSRAQCRGQQLTRRISGSPSRKVNGLVV